MSAALADERPTRTRLAALDGFRALAITSIVLFHFHVRDDHLVPGAYVGVEMFFALSGFLITTTLVARYARGSRHLGRHFDGRPATRPLPAPVRVLAVW